MDLNVVSFTGRLTRDPELSYTKNGKAVVKYGVAINGGWGETKTVHFVDCTSWQKTAEFIGQYLKKGARVAGAGRLDYQSWEDKQTGKKRTKVGIVVTDIIGLDKKGEHQNDAPVPDNQDNIEKQAEEIFG